MAQKFGGHVRLQLGIVCHSPSEVSIGNWLAEYAYLGNERCPTRRSDQITAKEFSGKFDWDEKGELLQELLQ
jgi:hypothetical protein